MARSSDVVKKVMRFKLQLTATAESATVLKTLQKLKDLDITLDILAETGIGKIVNSLRRHEEAGELAKSLVRGWKKLVPKAPTSLGEDGDVSDNMPVKDKPDDQNRPNDSGLTAEDLNNNRLTTHGKSRGDSNETLFKKGDRKPNTGKLCDERKRKKDQDEEKGCILKKDKMKKNCVSSGSEKESHNKSKSSRKSPDRKESFSYKSRDNPSKKDSKKLSKLADVKENKCSGISRSSDARNKKKNKKERETYVSKLKKFEYKGPSKNNTKNDKRKHEDEGSDKRKHEDEGSDIEDSSMSFESFLNYDENVSKRKERSGGKKAPKKIKTAVKRDRDWGRDGIKPEKTPVRAPSPKPKFTGSVMDLVNIPLPAVLPECDNPCVEYFERKVEKESDFCEVSEESAVFTGQRLNKKMQVYSGAKTAFIPVMMSLYQLCIRTLQNNINLLHETGGVPFEILEPILERCTPEQLLHVEECNPIYIGETDHLWGRHCQRDFKDAKLQEYESWKEMYTRLSEEREMKLRRLTKSIVSAHSNKPKGRQVKMAFIHTVAKPPRDVRIQQEIHGTAVQQPHPPRSSSSVKVQESRSKPSAEPTRSSSTSSGPSSNTQDPRKKTRVAPMMAKSLKAFKKQLGRR